MAAFEKIFPTDAVSKRERVELTLQHKPVDRVALHEQLSYNPGVISLYTGRQIVGFDYTVSDIGAVARKTVDMHFPLFAPQGTMRIIDEDGFVSRADNWTVWRVSRPFSDLAGARRWFKKAIEREHRKKELFDGNKVRREYRRSMRDMQQKVGQTVICHWSMTGFCSAFDCLGLELHTYLTYEYPGLLSEFMQISTANELDRIHAVADKQLSPVILIPEDFSTKQGPIFPPDFLNKYHYPYVKLLTDAWHSYDIKVLYHSDGNYKKAIPGLMACGVDGFYCLEPGCGMHIIELKNTWPSMVWAGGVDGVDLMERGTPEQVRCNIHRHIEETNALATGGMFVASSSEINPPIKPENFKAMIEAVGELFNPDF